MAELAKSIGIGFLSCIGIDIVKTIFEILVLGIGIVKTIFAVLILGLQHRSVGIGIGVFDL